MSALRIVKREIGPRTWFSLVRLDDGRVAMGGLRSHGEAEAWAMEAGHTIGDAPAKVTVTPPAAGDGFTPEQIKAVFTGIGQVVAADPTALVSPDPLWETNGTGKWHSLPKPAQQRPRPTGPALAPVDALPRPTKDTAPCCLAKRLPDGRPVIGFCGPECRRRPARSAT